MLPSLYEFGGILALLRFKLALNMVVLGMYQSQARNGLCAQGQLTIVPTLVDKTENLIGGTDIVKNEK